MPTISLDGRLVGKIFLCLNEASNQFGPLDQKQVEHLENIFPFVKIVCSKSGKLNKELIGVWIKDRFSIYPLSEAKKKHLLLLESWAGQWNSDSWKQNWPSQINLKKVKIPEGTTGECQPLDTGFNSYLKYILKRCDVEF